MGTILRHLALPVPPVTLSSPEVVILEQKVKAKTKEPIPSGKKH